MGDSPFRRKPYMDSGIDILKVLLMVAIFLLLVTALAWPR